MLTMVHRLSAIGLGVLMWSATYEALGVITAKAPLAKFEADAVYILVGKVEKYFPEKPALLVTAIEDIKGKAPFRQLPINCKVDDAKAAKANLIEPLLKRFGPDLEIIFFLEPRGKKSYVTFGFANGTWFQLRGTKVDTDRVVFRLLSAEPNFRGSFKGTTAELRKLLKDHAAGRGKLPTLDDKAKPGLGPEYQAPKKGARLDPAGSRRLPAGLGGGQLFAVIPTIGLGAPLAILALLFPTVFGGVFVLFRQWLAFLTLISVNSTLVLLQWWLGPSLRATWWGTDAALWCFMTLTAFTCTVWAWRRQLNSLAAGAPDAPERTELAVLAFMTASCTAALAVMAFYARRISWVDVGWTMTVVMTLGVFAGLLYRLYRHYRGQPVFGAPPLATEGVILGSMLLGHLAFAPGISGGAISTAGTITGGDPALPVSVRHTTVKKTWEWTLEPRIRGMYASAPLIDGDAIYCAFSGTNQYATLFKLDRHTGKKIWDFFGKDDDLKQMISTPCLADGKLYFGEGFHDDKNCRVFCVDAASGEEVWTFRTAGQTESSPAAAHGRVFIGAGNVGVFCLDAAKGTEIWKYPPDAYTGRLLRFGAGMTVVGGRLYCGTGVDRNQTDDKGETAIFCFDANSGKPLWKTPAPYPVWSTPVIRDGFVYVTTGNGDVYEDAKPPATPGGALLCLDVETGRERWRFKTPNGIIESPAVDEGRIYFGCRDGHLYSVGRGDGQLRWKRFLDTPVIASPVLDIDPANGRTLSVFAAAAGGKVGCFDPHTSHRFWYFNLAEQNAYISASPRLAVSGTLQGSRRHLYFGAGLGGGLSDINANRPVFYCLEDVVGVE